MLTRFFRQDRLTALLPLPLLVLLLWPGASTGGGSPYATGTGLLGHMVTGMPLYLPISHLMELAPWVASVVSMLVLSGVAMGLVRMANDTELYERRNFLPSLLVVVLLALLPFGLLPDPAMLGMWAVLWALGRTWRAVGRPNVRTALFDAGLLLGLASLPAMSQEAPLARAAAELIDEVGRLDKLVVCIGGGGLISGAAVAAQLFNAMVGSGMGEEDNMAVIKLIEKLAGIEE